MKNVLPILVIFLVFSCRTTRYKSVDFGHFQITVPENWNKYERQGIDSFVGGLITDTNDTLTFDLGQYSGDVSDDLPMVYDSESIKQLTQKERKLLPETKHLIVDDLFTADVNMKEYLKYNSQIDTIDGFLAKIITPTNQGYGASGIYIDSLRGMNNTTVKFNFYGFHLPKETQTEFLESLKTLQFK